jgi:diguanylate cyclase (GGDEF)-like protein
MPDNGEVLDGNLSLEECRKISMERFGLSSETRDFNIYRILNLAKETTNALAAGFAVSVKDRAALLALAGLPLREPAAASPGCQTTIRKGLNTTLQNIDITEWRQICPSLQGGSIHNYIGLPVYNSQREVIGSFSLFFGSTSPTFSEELFKTLNDFCRLIEDSLALRSLSIRDPLTGLFNRRYLEQQANIEWRRALRLHVPFTVAMLDVDHFKAFNDTAGHLAGDRVLIELAAVINKICLRAGDSACRFGGEEFAIILPMTSGPDAEVLIGRIKSEFAQLNFDHPAFENKLVTFSAGITTKDTKEDLEKIDIATCFREADKALYAAKNQGRNRTLHYKDL